MYPPPGRVVEPELDKPLRFGLIDATSKAGSGEGGCCEDAPLANTSSTMADVHARIRQECTSERPASLGDETRCQRRPSRLMARAAPAPRLRVEVLVEEHQVTPVRIVGIPALGSQARTMA
jgi:hypothetical protein